MPAWMYWPIFVVGYVLAAYVLIARRHIPGMPGVAALLYVASTSMVVVSVFRLPPLAGLPLLLASTAAALAAAARTRRVVARLRQEKPAVPEPRRQPVPPPPRDERIPWWTTYN